MAEQPKKSDPKAEPPKPGEPGGGTPPGLAVPVMNYVPAGSPGPAPVPPEQPQTLDGKDAAPATPAVPPADLGYTASRPVEWARDLVTELGATGTGAAKLDVIRRAMLDRFNDPEHKKKSADDPDRHLTAREALDVLEKDDSVPELTRVKARALVETGKYVPAASAVLHDADRIPPPKGKAPKREGQGARGQGAKGPEKKDGGLRPRAGEGPGVESDAEREIRHAGMVEGTVGAKPVEPPKPKGK